MASVTITIPDPQVDRVRAALAAYLQMDVADVGLPELKSVLVDQLKAVVRAGERNAHRDNYVEGADPDVT